MLKNIYLWTLKIGLAASFITFFLVSKDLYFPYITTKQITFNILIEVLTIIWLALIIRFPEVRPKKSWITWGLAAFLGAVLISSLAGVDFALSFWGNLERMMAFFPLVHFFLYYLILITVMRSDWDWFWLLNLSVLVGVIITILGMVNNYSASTIGNTEYVAGLMIFDFWFAVWLMLKTKSWWLKLLYAVAGVMAVVGLIRADINGANLGLAVSLVVFGLIMAFTGKQKILKIVCAATAIGLVLAVGVAWSFRDAPIFNNNTVGHLLRGFSGQNVTLNTRLLSWSFAAKGFWERPVFGTGFGNYAAVFDKYFSAKFYDWTQEDRFDRAHNNIVDLTITTGIVGILAYLSIFAAVAYYLWRGYKHRHMDGLDLAMLFAVLVGYFIHNLAVFDALVNYVTLMIVFGLVYYFSKAREKDTATAAVLVDWQSYTILGLAAILLLATVYEFNVVPLQMINKGLNMVITWNSDPLGSLALAQQVNQYDSALARDLRSGWINAISGNPVPLDKMTVDQRNQVFATAIDMGQKNLAFNPQDAFHLTEQARLVALEAEYAGSRQGFAQINSQALDLINQAIAASPEHLGFYLIKAWILTDAGRTGEAIDLLEQAAGLSAKYYELPCYAARLRLLTAGQSKKNDPLAYNDVSACLDNGGAGSLVTPSNINDFIKHYQSAKDWSHVVALYQFELSMNPNDTSSVNALKKAQEYLAGEGK